MAEKKTAKTEEEKAKKPAAKKPAAEKKTPAKKEAAPKAVKEETKPVETETEESIDDEIIELVSEDGETKKFFHVATIDYENEWFVFFQPAQKTEEEDEDEVVVFKLDSDENDNDVFLPVQSEELLHKVYGEYLRLMTEQDDGEGCPPSDCAGCPNKCK